MARLGWCNDREQGGRALRIQYVTAFLLGVIATFLGVIVFEAPRQPLSAQTVDGGGGYVVGTAQVDPAAKNFVWVLNATERGSPRLCIYEARETSIALKYARNLTYDFWYDQFPARADSHIPAVQDVMNENKKKREAERKGAAPVGEKEGEKKP